MANKKTAKKTKNQTKKNKPKARRDPLPRCIGLHNKILKVMELLPEIPCTGEEYDDTQQDIYYYTEAAAVFKLYTAKMVEVGLTFVPISMKTEVDRRFYKAEIIYRLTDPETGQYQDVVAVGLGCNGVWALNSAQTVARKQALLNTFGASYPQPDKAKPNIRKIARGFDVNDVLTSEKARTELVEYDFFNKEKQDGNEQQNSGGSGQSVSDRRGSKKDSPRSDTKTQSKRKRTAKTGRQSNAKTN